MHIHVEAVRKQFGAQLVLQDVSFSIPSGRTVGLLGPNGSGKTTIVRLLNGVITPDAGTMQVGDWDPVQDGHSIRRHSGVLTDGAGLYHELSGLENLRFFAKLYRAYDEARIAALLEEFQLTEHQHKRIGTYSTGMKRRLGFIKALLHKPQLLFLDEPTNGLDPEGIQLVITYIRRLKKEGVTILLCSHILQQLELVCDSYLFLERGNILEAGTKAQLEERYVTDVKLRVETGLTAAADYAGYPVERIDGRTLRFSLPDKTHITPLLQRLTAETWVHGAEIEARDLESLYFRIRGQQHE